MRGRKPPGPEIVDRLDGTDDAKQRLHTILRTLVGELHLTEAAELLHVTTQWLSGLEIRALQAALTALEAKAMGRPKKQVSAEQQRIDELEQEVRRLEQQVRVGYLREEVAALLEGQPEPVKKKTRRQRRRPPRT